MTNEKALKGRAKRKTITEALLLNLVKITDEKKRMSAGRAIGIAIIVSDLSLVQMVSYTASIVRTGIAHFAAASERRKS